MVRTQIRHNQVWFFYTKEDGTQANGIIEHYNVKPDTWAVTMWTDLGIKLIVTLVNGEAFHTAFRRDRDTDQDAMTNEIVTEAAKQAIEFAIREFKVRAFPQLGSYVGQGTVNLRDYS